MRRFSRQIVCVFAHLFFSVILVCSSAGAAPITADAVATGRAAAHTRASLFVEAQSVAPGQTLRIGLRLVSQPKWHTYWKEPGEAGFATFIEWQTVRHGQPAAGDKWLWPEPKTFVQGGIRSSVLEGDSVIFIPLTVSANARAGDTVELQGKISWLECDEKSCVPQETEVTLKIPVAGDAAATEAPPAAGAVENKTGSVHQAGLETRATPSASPVENQTAADWQPWTPEAQAALLASGRIVYVDFTARWCATCQVNKRVYADAALAAALRQHNVALLRADWTRRNPEIAAELARYGRAAVPFNVFLKAGREPVALGELLTSGSVREALEKIAAAADTAETPRLAGRQSYSAAPAAAAATFSIGHLLFGFVGGFLLNLMPCVFPVLGLKVMSFARQSGESRRRVTAHGLVFTAGVLASFWVLAGALVLLRRGGMQLGWGFQLQEPAFVLALAVLLLVLALNMAGVFEVGTRAMGVGDALAAKPGLRGSFFSGVLATIAATPCAAPFLGVALGAALTLPAADSFLVFTAIALGLSAPYLALSAMPGLARLLPAPGAWMETFKQGLSFLLFASVAWLLWVLVAQVESVAGIFFGMVAVAFACWIYGRWSAPHRAKRTRWTGTAVALALFAGTCAWMFAALTE